MTVGVLMHQSKGEYDFVESLKKLAESNTMYCLLCHAHEDEPGQPTDIQILRVEISLDSSIVSIVC